MPHIDYDLEGFWVNGLPEGMDRIGPYRTKAEAVEARDNALEFARMCDEPGYLTIESPRGEPR